MHHSFDHADAKEEKPSPRTNRTTKHQVNGVEGRDTAAHCLHHEPKHAGQAARRYRDTNHTMQPRGATRCTDPLEPRTTSPPGDRKADRNVVDRPRRTKRQGQERPDRPRGCPVLGWSQPRRQRSSLGQVAQVGGSPTCRSGLSALFGPRLIRRPTRLATTRFNPGGPTACPKWRGKCGHRLRLLCLSARPKPGHHRRAPIALDRGCSEERRRGPVALAPPPTLQSTVLSPLRSAWGRTASNTRGSGGGDHRLGVWEFDPQKTSRNAKGSCSP